MEASTLTALSPLDGRYARKTTSLRRFVSEYALIRYRVLIEVRWLQHLADDPQISDLAPLEPPVKDVLNKLVDDFSGEDAMRVRELERVTNHDVKAVEYFLREKLEGVSTTDGHLPAYIHFACTSEDINNLAYALMLRDARQRVLIPQMKLLCVELRAKAAKYSEIAMLSRTHGQAATPTTLGKELANIVCRLERQQARVASSPILGKMNGAVGNFNAHVVAYPAVDWPAVAQRFVESLDLETNAFTTQIEPHDWIAEYCHAFMGFNTVLLDLCRDIWGYVSLGYFRSRPVEDEVGSSTMPHKVNPIEFENAEGNLGMANAVFGHLAAKLPISRWQRDLTDSTVLRNAAVGLGHTLLAIEAGLKGLGKLDASPERIDADLADAWEVLAEAVQTVMRRYGVADAYEQLKAISRGRSLTRESLHEFIRATSLPDLAKKDLLELTPATYIGLAVKLTRQL